MLESATEAAWKFLRGPMDRSCDEWCIRFVAEGTRLKHGASPSHVVFITAV